MFIAMPAKQFFFCTISLCVLLTLGIIEAAPASSLVTQLPGFNGTFPSKHYAGYISLAQNPEKDLFYYFVVSERNPSRDPVVLWLNGGPGCSSMGGFVYEHGPFNFEGGKPNGSLPTLHLNPYSWSKVSNIIYLDSPAGVGLSYRQNYTNQTYGDLQTASDTHSFLLKWFERFLEFLGNPFIISGESYAGVYVPTLASEVVKGIENGTNPIINFKGYMVGNAITDQRFDYTARVPFAHGMGLISDDIYEKVVAACKGNYNIYDVPENTTCYEYLNLIYEIFNDLNWYDILEPCYRASPLCFNDDVSTLWLNDKAVRKAIHSLPENVTGPWELCSSAIGTLYPYRGAGSMIPYHINLTKQGYRALVYSGDHDLFLPFTGSQAWTRSLRYEIVDAWRPWNSSNGQVAGFLQGYANNLTFLTIKGAGHNVPEYKPREALDFFSRWLEGKQI